MNPDGGKRRHQFAVYFRVFMACDTDQKGDQIIQGSTDSVGVNWIARRRVAHIALLGITT